MQRNFKILLFLVILSLILMFLKNTEKYTLYMNFEAHCSHELGGVENYYEIIPKDIWVNSSSNGITIYTHFKNAEEVLKERNKLIKLADQIIKKINEKKSVYSNRSCRINYSNKNNGDRYIAVKKPKLIFQSEKVLKNTYFLKIRYIIYLIYALSVFLILKRLQKINFLNLHHL